MKVFWITASNQVRVFASEQEALEGEAVFGSTEQLAALVREWPTARRETTGAWLRLPSQRDTSD